MHPGQFIGREIDGFRIEDVIGTGGMGVVFRAVDVLLDRTVAIKLVNPALVSDPSFVRRLGREARALARLQSPHIVTIHALRRTDFGLFIVMEYVDGQTLGDWASGEAVPWKELWPILHQTLTALGHAHATGIVHRDIKPANIMRTMSGRAKVMDFGIAKLLSEGTATVTQGITGTLYYMSPEQIERPAEVDGRSDLYSLGMTAYCLLTAALPFEEGLGMMSLFRAIVEVEPPPIRSLNAKVPHAAAALVERALEKDPARRFQTAGEMLKAMEDIENSYEAPTVVEVSGGARDGDDGRRSRWGRWILAAVILIAVVGGVVAGAMSLVSDGADAPISAALSPLERDAKIGEAESDGDPADSVEGSNEEDADTAPTSLGAETPGFRSGTDEQISPGSEPGGAAVALESADSTETAAPDDGPEETDEAVISEGVALVQSNPRGASIYINRQYRGRTPARVTLPAGRYLASLVLDGYATASVAVQIIEGQEREVNKTLEPAYGTLTVSVLPFGDVYVDGELLQEDVGFPRQFKLQTGAHTLKVQHPELGSREQQIRIIQDEDLRVRIDLSAE